MVYNQDLPNRDCNYNADINKGEKFLMCVKFNDKFREK